MAAVTMNVFLQDAFSGLSLTEQVNRNPYVPNYLGTFGTALFEDMPIITTGVEIDRKDGVLNLIASSPRGAPAQQRVLEKRQGRLFFPPRLKVGDTIRADSLQNVRTERNGDINLKDLQEEVAIRLAGETGLTMYMEYTWEYHRLGAVQGVLLDASGTPIYNWFNEFGITPATEIGFNLAAATPGSLRTNATTVARAMRRAGKGAFLEGRTKIYGVCGDGFWNLLVTHPDFVSTYVNWAALNGTVGAPELRSERAFEEIYYGGIYWKNYRGSDDNATIAVASDKVKFFPVGAPGVFKRVLAPGEGFEELNVRGRPMTVYRNIDPETPQKWVRFDLVSYPLHICTRPEMLQSGRSEA